MTWEPGSPLQRTGSLCCAEEQAPTEALILTPSTCQYVPSLSEETLQMGLNQAAGDDSGLSRWALNVTARVLLRRRQRSVRGDVGCEDRHRAGRRGGARPLALKPEGGATSQGIQAAPRSCASRERIPSQRLRKERALPTLDCSSVRPTSEV